MADNNNDEALREKIGLLEAELDATIVSGRKRERFLSEIQDIIYCSNVVTWAKAEFLNEAVEWEHKIVEALKIVGGEPTR